MNHYSSFYTVYIYIYIYICIYKYIIYISILEKRTFNFTTRSFDKTISWSRDIYIYIYI